LRHVQRPSLEFHAIPAPQLSVQPQPDLAAVYDIRLEPADNARLANICGPFDQHLKQLERRLGVDIVSRGNSFQVSGPSDAARAAGEILRRMYMETESETLTPERVHLYLHDAGVADALDNDVDDEVVVKVRRGHVRGRGANQSQYLRNIFRHDINFGVGPAGTGKTYLAVACAVEAYEKESVRRVVLVRPAVEAGERLGFLPGDMAQKVDPYLRPLYDALQEMLGFERVAKLIERNVIEVAPLAYMRGRTLNESFIILDEAQNTSVEQMKMFLSRIGFSSTAVITGDITQIDLPRGQRSGLRHVIDVLRGVEGISFTFFDSKDVVRHPLVARILDAYEAHEEREGEGRDGHRE
jgi:phosphate starvation-inducible PhoH-like protein